MTHQHDPTNCGAELAARQPSQIIGVSTETVKCSNPKCQGNRLNISGRVTGRR